MENSEKPNQIDTGTAIVSNLDSVTGRYLSAHLKNPIGQMSVEEIKAGQSQRAAEAIHDWMNQPKPHPKPQKRSNLIESGDHDQEWRDK